MNSRNYERTLPRFDTFSVGFDRILDRLLEPNVGITGTYPPYDIVRLGSESNEFEIRLAVAGFSFDEIDITWHKSTLTVKSVDINPKEDDNTKYLHKGIANRTFERKFTLADTVVVTGADMRDGILYIKLRNEIPEEEKPRKIEIAGSNKQLLAE